MGKSKQLIVPQPKLGYGGLVGILVVANILVPLSLDMYTPSVPEMPGYFHTNASVISLTLVSFQLFFSIGLLLFGPITDKFGRKPVLVGGIGAYALSSALCALSFNVWMLIFFRVIEGLGAGAVGMVSTAIVKDCFEPEMRKKMLSILQVFSVIGPVAAPLIGGVIITYTSWQMTFWVLAIIGGLCTVASLLYTESQPESEKLDTGVLRSLLRLGVVARNKPFMIFLLAASMFCLPFMAYVASGSYIYVDIFGLTAQQYTYFFAATAALSAIGPMLYLHAPSWLNARRLTWLLFAVNAVCAVLLLVAGHTMPAIFCVILVFVSMVQAAARPYSTNILLSLNEGDTGSASAMLNFVYTFAGCLGMQIIVLPLWPDYITGLGVVTLISVAIGIVLWLLMLKGKDGLEKFE